MLLGCMWPLKDKTNDESFKSLFKPIMQKLIEVYMPTAVVFQSGMLACMSKLLLNHMNRGQVQNYSLQ